MRLKTIKLAGFKSFVEPTVIQLNSNLAAVVGPNGCGKSNIVDAVRWVIGESSAKYLRAESISDVIFNGTQKRKPLAQAAVELVFDNSDGSLGGQYAEYNELSVRRVLARDGQSQYFLNNTRCRRRDVVDLFLDTGLGPRSYAIVGQGMISDLVTAQPEELAVYLKHVSGISKYEDRRRDTENRIGHTRENLERLADVREEVDKQCKHLKRQAKAAERYQVLSGELRQLKAQLQAMQWKVLQQDEGVREHQIKALQTQVDAKVAEQRRIDADIEGCRDQQTAHNEALNDVQGRYYRLGADIARMEQRIQHSQEREVQLKADLQQIDLSEQEVNQNLADDKAQVEQLEKELQELEPDSSLSASVAEQSQIKLDEAERQMKDWQLQWDEFVAQSAQATQQVEVEQTQIQHLAQRLELNSKRRERLRDELSQLSSADGGLRTDVLIHPTDSGHGGLGNDVLTHPTASGRGVQPTTVVLSREITQLGEQCEKFKITVDTAQAEINTLNAQITTQREQLSMLDNAVADDRDALQKLHGRQASLEVMQKAALGDDNEAMGQWLEKQGLADKPRLAQQIQVETGWELAVETVLGGYLEAVCVEDMAAVISGIADWDKKAALSFFDAAVDENAPKLSRKGSFLLNKIQSPFSLRILLGDVYAAEDLAEAMQLREGLSGNESVVTPDGVWMGPSWLRVGKAALSGTDKDLSGGVIQRERELKALMKEIKATKTALEKQAFEKANAAKTLTELEGKHEQVRRRHIEVSSNYADLRAQLQAKQAQLAHLERRQTDLSRELEEMDQQVRELELSLSTARESLAQARVAQTKSDALRGDLMTQRDACQIELEESRERMRTDKKLADALAVKLDSANNQLHFLSQGIKRAEKQLLNFKERRESLLKAQEGIVRPVEGAEEALAAALDRRIELEKELGRVRQTVENLEHQIRQSEGERTGVMTAMAALQGQLEELRLSQKTVEVRAATHEEQIEAMGLEIKTVLAELEAVEDADPEVWSARIEATERRIERLGQINLMAIDEYAQLEKREAYLTAQNDDLERALTTLEEAIHKIDKETRQRFKETYEVVNEHFQRIFPSVFNGGQARLEVTHQDWLKAGVVIMAQPPGKRNTSITALSGGEKALTAIALVFSLFQLNPAPFCMLDEVDAPLDDVNIGRFCQLVQKMAEQVQFIFVTHSKVAMEMGKELLGITMNEPGVSRMVSVDIDAAIAMVD